MNKINAFVFRVIFFEIYVSSSYENYTEIKNGYVVWSPSCKIPRLDPLDESVRKFLIKWPAFSCQDKIPVITKTGYDERMGANFVSVSPFAAAHIPGNRDVPVNCCYKSIWRKTNGIKPNKYKLLQENCFENRSRLRPEVEFIFVYCGRGVSEIHYEGKSAPYKHVHAVVNGFPSNSSSPSTYPKYSVSLIGIDSISRLNLPRSMPLTAAYIQQRGWNPLEGYTKIDDNTFPNLAAVLTGMRIEPTFRETCWKTDSTYLDDCPFVWKDFRRVGYETAYVEDYPMLSTFEYEKRGFKNAPTRYYAQHFLEAGEKLLPVQMHGNLPYCMGRQPQAEYLMQYHEEFAGRLSRVPYFSLFWLNTFSHNYLTMPTIMDERMKTFLRSLEPFWESTIVIFFSDHGMRFGGIRSTYVGWQEERTPFMYFRFPDSSKRLYPQFYWNFVQNKNRLTSPFDLHVTLKHILNLRQGVNTMPDEAPDCPDCRSLFHAIPSDRSCQEAGIRPHWCVCDDGDEPVSAIAEDVSKAAKLAVSRINRYVRSMEPFVQNGTKCEPYTIGKVLSARFRRNTNEYVILFRVLPNDADFEATVKVNGQEMAIESSSTISRINAYNTESYCAFDATLKKYCFCKRA